MLNPSRPRRPTPDWTDFVFSEMAQQLSRRGFSRPADAWLYFRRLADHTPASAAAVASSAAAAVEALAVGRTSTTLIAEAEALDEAAKAPLDAAGFRRALGKLDFECGDALGTLTEAEVLMLIESCDRDGDGCVDGLEWCERFGAALRRLRDEAVVADAPDASADLEVSHAALTPRCLEEGTWPDEDEWDLSDHGVVQARFVLASPDGPSPTRT